MRSKTFNKSNNKIVLILPYFGKLPDFFPFFIESIKNNKNIIDLLLITESNINIRASNIKIVKMTLVDLNLLIKKKLGNYKIKKPYKLCDYKPCYGKLFNDYIKNYDWWGWTDCDLIYGNISSFLNKISINKYDQVFIHGHFALIKNNEKMNNMAFNIINGYSPLELVLKTNCQFQFDEKSWFQNKYSFPLICKKYNCSIYDARIFADVLIKDFNFTYKIAKNNKLAIVQTPNFMYDNGNLFTIENNKKREILYAHFQKRNIKISDSIKSLSSLPKKYLIIPNYICLYEEKIGEAKINECEKEFYKRFKRDSIVLKLKSIKKIAILAINFKLNKF